MLSNYADIFFSNPFEFFIYHINSLYGMVSDLTQFDSKFCLFVSNQTRIYSISSTLCGVHSITLTTNLANYQKSLSIIAKLNYFLSFFFVYFVYLSSFRRLIFFLLELNGMYGMKI